MAAFRRSRAGQLVAMRIEAALDLILEVADLVEQAVEFFIHDAGVSGPRPLTPWVRSMRTRSGRGT